MTRVTYVGHATVLIAMDGVRLLTDPLLRNRVTHLRRRAGLDLALVRDPDAVLVSHAHYDHLDLGSLERLGRSTPIVVPRGLGGILRQRGYRRVTEVEEGDRFAEGALTLEATRADHRASRRPLSPHTPSLGYLVTGSHRVYFAGDTALFDDMATLSPGLDVALVPIWGWGPGLGRGEHMDPDQAARAVALLQPRIAVPIHWGTYHPLHIGLRRPPGYLQEPPEAFRRAAAEHAPGVEIRVLQPGESLEL
ncbi:MAG TPA: MBL fold metallo-hydrolase [Gaiellaceae bacterium]|nr:MBL fold metallo-hydrolase [Gaiellaceae bacterium]